MACDGIPWQLARPPSALDLPASTAKIRTFCAAECDDVPLLRPRLLLEFPLVPWIAFPRTFAAFVVALWRCVPSSKVWPFLAAQLMLCCPAGVNFAVFLASSPRKLSRIDLKRQIHLRFLFTDLNMVISVDFMREL